MSATYSIFVPTADSPIRVTVLPGSALVGVWRETEDDGRVLQIDYEGNAYGAEGLNRFAQRCMHAAGRLAADYPSSARMLLLADRTREELVEVGVYDDGERLVFLDGDEQRAVLAAWLGHEEIAPDELHAR